MSLQRRELGPHLPMSPGVLLIAFSLLSAATHVSGAHLRAPNLELVQDGNAVVYFYNRDILTNKMEDVVSCAVSGAHYELTKRGWEKVPRISIQLNPQMEYWYMPEKLTRSPRQIMQTRTRYKVIYDGEGNLTCHDTLEKKLKSNTIILQPKNSATVLVKLKKDQPLGRIELILREYNWRSSSILKARLVDWKNGSNSEIVLRVIYSNGATITDDKIVNDVREWTRFIAKNQNYTVDFVRSTRFCPSVVEGNSTWPMTAAGVITSPKNYCLDADGMPAPRRKCIGDYFQGVYWDSPPGRPNHCLNPLERSTSLRNLTKSFERKKLLEVLSNQISEGGGLSSVEIYFASEVLKKAAEEVSNGMLEMSSIKTATIGKIVNSILHSGCGAVKSSDESYGSSKLILEAVEELLQAAASPMPTPISLSHFSAFASVSGTGIRGFNYSTVNGVGKMETVADLLTGDTTVACTYPNATNASTVATYYNNGCLFIAANSAGRNSLGPVFGMKMFDQGGETSEEQTPVQLTILFTIEKKTETLQCASWNPSMEGGWSTAGCYVVTIEDKAVHCICTLLKYVQTFFTLIDSGEVSRSNETRLAILPLKNNVGALLHLYTIGKRSKYTLEKKIKCTLKRNETEESIKFTRIGEFAFTFVHRVYIFSLSSSSEGDVQCSFANTSISNKCLLLVQNRAFVKLRAPNSLNVTEKLQKYEIEHDLKFNISMPAEEIFLVSQYSKKEHLKFMDEVKRAFNDMSALYNFTLIGITSNRLCLKHEEGGFLWPNTKLGYHATPINPCLDENGVPTPKRLCKGDYSNGMFWDKVPESPKPCNRPSNKTQKLFDLVEKKEEKNILEVVSEVLEKEVIDITAFKDITNILNEAAEETSLTNSKSKANISTLATIVNQLVTAEFESPEEDEERQVLSEEILDAVDKLLEKSSSDKPQPIKLSNFAAAAASPGSTYRGFVDLSEDSDSASPLVTVSWKDDEKEMFQKPIRAGALLLDGSRDSGVTLTIYKNISLFKSNKNLDLIVDTPVVGMKIIPDDKKEDVESLNMTIIILFPKGNATSSKRRDCYYWDPKAKQWSNKGLQRVSSCYLDSIIPEGTDACISTHLTHFAMLMSTKESFTDSELLELLTLICCSISLVCILGIFVVALISKKWRAGAGKKVQINLSASLAMMMASYLAITGMGECPRSMAWCIALGALMHYSVIASFSWMVVVAVLQLVRLSPHTSVDSRRHTGSHVVLKTSILGWGLPLIPVAGTLAASLDNYERRPNSSFCYPRDRAFYIGVYFPIALAVTINIIVFIWLMNVLFCNKMKGIRVHQKSQAVRRVFSALFLFCLLGIAYIPGILLEVTIPSETVSNILSYLLCTTATLQGASLFIFFVACDRKVGNKVKEAMSSLTSGSNRFRLHKLESSSSDRTNTTTENSQSTLPKKKKSSVSSPSN